MNIGTAKAQLLKEFKRLNLENYFKIKFQSNVVRLCRGKKTFFLLLGEDTFSDIQTMKKSSEFLEYLFKNSTSENLFDEDYLTNDEINIDDVDLEIENLSKSFNGVGIW